ncbi:MogA/MoaB family molybdenum cofactor biosynthesis protein [Pimelobacter simplex]|uniref:MogA/MoaB family molybdenum cofactor biosynthesis protein n=1 Tax=Nocardioides simplex TaxID=2045 RepID=UPI00215047BD|nr:MogA/MoaB family molybdenum cofactor biosynthesis protein [Pimelobacter simplex]UUW92529.1 MogA/MoaB family molybdenum cofactor biosynthesis protein [Pimelobacter simplex]UUW96357.1 MogA/MoaB family molybdenum cofactor biosynthesis protein [Pimelobacter simplex]
MKATVIVASDRAAAGTYLDETGPIIVAALRSSGFDVDSPVVVPDGPSVAEAIRCAISDGARIVLTTGGTGLSPSDRTPEVTGPLLDVVIPGIAEAIRARGTANGVPSSVLSRGLAGVASGAVVINLPGSESGAKDGLEVVLPVLHHLLHQLVGGDHERA